ncbi:FAD:protein FMN transferase, partial [Myxococcota bacterium]|nr:FAD:protein FMN transferase [Myxococcota bacterium]
IEKLMAVQKEGSELSKLNAEAGDNTIALSADTLQLLTKGLELSEKTQGAWTLTSGSLSKLWLFEKGANPPDPDTIAKKLKLVDDEKLNLDSKKSTGLLKKEGMVIDATEIVRGFAIEKARAHLLAKGVSDALIIAGGDIRTIGKKGDKSWVIGIQDPNAEGYFAILESSDEAIATSGDYSHFFIKDEVRYHSVLDPRSGQPARGVQSVTVISKDSMVSAAYSRAIFVLGTIEGIKLAEAEPDLEVVIVDDKNEVILSSGLRDRLRLARPITKD